MEISSLLKASLLYRQSYRVLNKVVSTVLADHSLTPIEWAFLSSIYYKDGITVSELAAVLSVEVPMITQLSLQSNIKPLIEMKRSEQDKRIKTIHLQKGAKKTLKKLEIDLNKTLETIFKDTSQRDLNAHLKVLQTIINNGI